MMFTQSRIDIDTGVTEEIIKLYKSLDRGRGGPCGTWHSKRINYNPHPWFQTTFDQVLHQIGALRIDEWWFNCGEIGDEYRWHEHCPYPYAAVLYIQTPENSGGIEFRRSEEYQTFYPQTGDFIQFCGNLPHRVQKNLSKDYRISVAFNLINQ